MVSRIKLRKMLSTFRMNDKSIDDLSNSLEKMHRHCNAILFVSMLERKGLKHEDIANVLRRIGIDDVTITNVFNMIDEQRIRDTYGKIVELVIE